MIVHPELRALRRDDAPQRAAQAILRDAMDAWRERPEIARLLGDVEAFAGYCAIDLCPTLAALFDRGNDAARVLTREFATTAVSALRQAQLGHLPLRNFTDGLTSTLLLARTGNVSLWLLAVDGRALAAKPEPVTADFGANELWEHVIAGHARAERIEARFGAGDDALLDRRTIELAPGDVSYRDAQCTALQIREVDGCLLLLRLARRRSGAGPTREYRLADGKLVHQAAGNPRDSRIELMMALLGRMDRADAAPLLAAIAGEEGTTALRWQALRECLALDTLVGFRALCEIAASPDDALAAPAGALRAQLVEAYPQLREVAPCPA